MFHQPDNTFGSKIYNAYAYSNTEYGTHFHKSFELIYCKSGALNVSVDDCSFSVKCGEFVLVFPYQMHSFAPDYGQGDCDFWISVFSGDLIHEFEKQYKNMLPALPKFTLSNHLYGIFESRFLHKLGLTYSDFSSLNDFTLKGFLYSVLGEFVMSTTFHEKSKDSDLVMQIVEYVEKNFKDNITLKTVADSLGYNFQYISRLFKRAMKINFRNLVNQYRFDYARLLLQQENVTITQVALDSGFQSVRNFNRIYKEKTGTSPMRRPK